MDILETYRHHIKEIMTERAKLVWDKRIKAETIFDLKSDLRYARIIYPFSTTSDRSILCTSQSEWLERAITLFESEECQVLEAGQLSELKFQKQTY